MRTFTFCLASLPTALATLAVHVAAQAVGGYRVESFTTAQGLPSQTVRHIAQTGDGFLWIAAGGMLARFDGHEFVGFNVVNTPALKRRVQHLHAGIGDTLWIVDEGGAVLAFADGRAREVVPPSADSIDQVRQDGQGILYGFAKGRVLRLGRQGVASVDDPMRAPLVPSADVPDFRDREGRVWVRDGVSSARVIGVAIPIKDSIVALVPSRSTGEMLFLRSRGRVLELARRNGEVVLSIPARERQRVSHLDRESRLWVVTPGAYEVYVRGQSDPVARIPILESGATLWLLEDEWGCTWATESALRRFCPTPFQTIPLSGDARLTVRRGPAGSVISWNAEGRVVTLTPDGASQTPLNMRPELRYGHLLVDRNGMSWWSPDPSTRSVRRAPPASSLPHESVSVYDHGPAEPDVIWYAHGDHLYRVRLAAAGAARVLDSIPVHGNANDIRVTRNGTVWATLRLRDLQPGLMRVSGTQVTTWTSRDGLPSAAVRAVWPDSDSTVWLGTYGSGLVLFRNGRFRAVTARDGLGEDVVTSLLTDGLGNLWMGGNRHVHRVTISSVEAVLAGRASRVESAVYGNDEGMLAPETTGQPGLRDRAGRLWFPTVAGAVVVDPVRAIGLDSVPPRVHLLGLRVGNQPVEFRQGITLRRGQRRVALTYTGISFRRSADVRFEYRLDGTDTSWLDAGPRREATFASLGPGRYTFRVRSINAGGVRSRDEASLAFVVPPLFHETHWFFGLLLMAAGAAAAGALQWRERRARQREVVLRQAVAERTEGWRLALDKVAAQTEQLRTLDQAKSRFFANVSHEFRTPLSLILGPVEDLRNGRAGELSASATRHLDRVYNNAQRLTQLVDQLLDIARLEAGTIHLRAEVRDLVPLLRRMADSFSSLAERRGITFRLSCQVGALRVRHDADQMEKVVSNLVGNALKFTPVGGSVELRASVESEGEGWALLEVEDSGPGIPPALHGRVFERFFQVDDSLRRAHEGAGIGLALVRELVELHGGTVGLRSEVGHGSTFLVRLPLASGAVRSAEHSVVVAPPPRAATPSVVPDQATNGLVHSDTTTVLVVEDNVELLDYLREHLAERYRVLVAADGARGLEMARAHVPDIIVSDVMMPHLDGQSLCAALKADPETDFIPVILLTARASRDARLDALEGGADEFLAKPVDLRELMIRVANLITSRQRVRERWKANSQELPSIVLPLKAPPRDASSKALLASLTTVLTAHLADEEFQVDAMAAAMGMGRSTLYRRLEPLLGRSPMEALWEFRMLQAAQWLTQTSLSVSEVAYGVGFKSVPHFCAKFRDRFGATPSGYRRTFAPGA